jgi:translation initiation factor IF-2
MVPISAKTGEGVDDLIEVILLLAELEELKDNSDEKPATALVVESSMHPQKGSLATLLVKQGTFKKNDDLFDGTINYGKIRSMTDYAGKSILSAGPSTPFQVIGLSQVPNVGDIIANVSQVKQTSAVQDTGSYEVNVDKTNIILKTDVQGSLEAIIASIKDEANVISASVGMVSDTDIQNASATKSEIVGFNTKMGPNVAKLAEVEKVKFTNFKIIYQLFDYLKDLKVKVIEAQGPKYTEIGQAKVVKVFNFGGTIIYGCICTSGKIRKGDLVQMSKVTSLKVGKEDMAEVKKDQEFGLAITPNIDLKAGDIIVSQSLEA